MPAFSVERSITIKAPAQRIFDTVSDFDTWTKWSPWLCIEPSAKVTVSDDPRSVGSTYTWSGNIVGAGEIKHVDLKTPTTITQQLFFLKPFKSKADVRFKIELQGESSKITWYMNSSLPWFMFWMVSMMKTFIGMDYDRGLKMLREYIETGTVLSKTDVIGVETTVARDVVGVRGSAPLNEIGPAMDKTFSTATRAFADSGITTDGGMASVYHPCDMKQGRMDFTSGYAVNEKHDLSSPLVQCHLPAGTSLHIRHVGSYDNLGNAWSGAHQYARYKKLKLAKRDAFEIYGNDPDQTPPAELITDIYLPLK